jgi:hypothetical protein
MIHVAMPALNSVLVNLGLIGELSERTRRTIGMLTLDPVVCLFHSPLEDQLLLLIENSELHFRGLGSIDEVVGAARALSRLLDRVAARYTESNIPARAKIVRELSMAIGAGFKWA